MNLVSPCLLNLMHCVLGWLEGLRCFRTNVPFVSANVPFVSAGQGRNVEASTIQTILIFQGELHGRTDDHLSKM